MAYSSLTVHLGGCSSQGRWPSGLMNNSRTEHCPSHFYLHILLNPLLSGPLKYILWVKIATCTALRGFSKVPQAFPCKAGGKFWFTWIKEGPTTFQILPFSGTFPASQLKAVPPAFPIPFWLYFIFLYNIYCFLAGYMSFLLSTISLHENVSGAWMSVSVLCLAISSAPRARPAHKSAQWIFVQGFLSIILYWKPLWMYNMVHESEKE